MGYRKCLPGPGTVARARVSEGANIKLGSVATDAVLRAADGEDDPKVLPIRLREKLEAWKRRCSASWGLTRFMLATQLRQHLGCRLRGSTQRWPDGFASTGMCR